jgi:hypothetical protein
MESRMVECLYSSTKPTFKLSHYIPNKGHVIKPHLPTHDELKAWKDEESVACGNTQLMNVEVIVQGNFNTCLSNN